MSILDNNTLPPAPPTPNKEQMLKQVSNRIFNLAKETFNKCVEAQRDGVKLVFEHPHLEPQEILDYLDDNALKVFQYHGGLTDFITQIAQNDGAIVELKSIPQSYTVNLSAGTITLL
jgi:superfamily II helicase